MDPLTEHQIFEEKRLMAIEQDIKEIHNEITRLSCDIADLVSAWKAANWIINLVKWLGGIALSVTAFMAMVKGIK